MCTKKVEDIEKSHFLSYQLFEWIHIHYEMCLKLNLPCIVQNLMPYVYGHSHDQETGIELGTFFTSRFCFDAVSIQRWTAFSVATMSHPARQHCPGTWLIFELMENIIFHATEPRSICIHWVSSIFPWYNLTRRINCTWNVVTQSWQNRQEDVDDDEDTEGRRVCPIWRAKLIKPPNKIHFDITQSTVVSGRRLAMGGHGQIWSTFGPRAAEDCNNVLLSVPRQQSPEMYSLICVCRLGIMPITPPPPPPPPPMTTTQTTA